MFPEVLLAYIGSIFGIVIIDLVLSGDNAVVIGMAARRLPPAQRRAAILLGGLGAILLRALFAAIAALLLRIPLLQALGGLLLVWIAWKLLQGEKAGHEVAEVVSIAGALRLIILADVVMSLDNILAIAGVSHGDLSLLLVGLVLSMPLVLVGSGIIATIMNRMPSLVMAGAGVLAWTAGSMIAEDRLLLEAVPELEQFGLLVPAFLTIALFVTHIVRLNRRLIWLVAGLATLFSFAGIRVCELDDVPDPVTPVRGRASAPRRHAL